MDVFVFQHGVHYGQTLTGTEVQQQNTAQAQFREAVTPNHTLPCPTIIAHFGVKAEQCVPSQSAIQHPSQEF